MTTRQQQAHAAEYAIARDWQPELPITLANTWRASCDHGVLAVGSTLDLAAAVANPAGTLQIDTAALTIAISAIAGDNTLDLGPVQASP